MTPSPPSPSARRVWWIIALLFGLSFVSYMERVNISVAAELMMPSLSLTRGQMAAVFNAFVIGYALFQIPAGWLGDRFGPRAVLGISALLWGVITLVNGFLPGTAVRGATVTLGTLWALRFLLGAAEASTYPVAARAVLKWVAAPLRARGNSLVLMGASAATAFTSPLVSFIMQHFGWRATFFFTSLFAFVIAALWTWLAPRHVTIRSSVEDRRARKWTWEWLDTNVALLGLSYFAEGYLLFMFVSWLYMYLVEVRGFSLVHGGFMSSLPWLVAVVATPLGGFLCDFGATRVGRMASARLLVMTGYAGSGILLLAAAESHSRWLAVAALSISLGSLYLAESSFWTVATLIAGEHGGMAGGFMNTIGMLGAIASNTLVPVLVERYGWIAAFSSGTVVGLSCTACWWFLGHRMGPIPSREAAV